ncbi:transposase [Schlegelella sp. ID0723]|uniref:Transposase n=1 Tax=Piscinibacter koreensis TaxID=2742824 RepID=A0A7Y6NQX4_9BURK|nr:transposase [Schlegelella koreensis]
MCRKEGFSSATFYKWRAKFGGMEASDAKRLRELEAENTRLKKLHAEAALDNKALKVAFGVKRLAHRRSDARWARCWKQPGSVNGGRVPWWSWPETACAIHRGELSSTAA